MFRCVFMIVLLVPAICAAELFQWTDANGVKHFSNTPPPAATTDIRQMEEYVGNDDARTDYLRQTLDMFKSGDDQIGAGTTAGSHQRTPEVIIYTTPTCGYCHRAKAYFKQHGIRFTEHDVTTSRKARRDFEALNGRGVPLILIGDQRINGFNKSAINQALGLR